MTTVSRQRLTAVGWARALVGVAGRWDWWWIMARVEVDEGQLVVRLSWPERLLALHGDERVPLSDARGVTVTDDLLGAVRGLRSPGTGVPGLVAVGTNRGRDWRDLVVAAGRGPGLVVTLAPGSRWRRLLIYDRHAVDTASRLQRSLRSTEAAPPLIKGGKDLSMVILAGLPCC